MREPERFLRSVKRSRKPQQTCKYCGRSHRWVLPNGRLYWGLVGTGGKGGKYEDTCPRCERQYEWWFRYGLPEPLQVLARCWCAGFAVEPEEGDTRFPCARCAGSGYDESRLIGALLGIFENELQGITVRGPVTVMSYRNGGKRSAVFERDFLLTFLELYKVIFGGWEKAAVSEEIQRRLVLLRGASVNS